MRAHPWNPSPLRRTCTAALVALAFGGATFVGGSASADTMPCTPDARATRAATDRAQQDLLLARVTAGSPAHFRLVEERGSSLAVLDAVERWHAAEGAVEADASAAADAARVACS
jgi:hypothetical protein